MQIILLSEAGRKTRRVCMGPLGLAALVLTIVLFAGSMLVAGNQWAKSESRQVIAKARSETQALWQDDLSSQRHSLELLRVTAERSLDAMARRLSLLQGYVLRLDALGSRLAQMANLSDMDFGVNNPPGMGGPISPFYQESAGAADLLNAIDELEARLQDRSEKLSAMESLLIDRSLRERTSPEGRPASGGWVSSLYGYRADPVTGKREFHQGMDFAGRPETPITAAAAGIVTWSAERFGYGHMVEINHGDGYSTRYAHNSKNLVSVGEKVDKGEVIALMGNSGRSTGTHVHFEVVRYGKHLNPRRFLSSQ